MLPPPKKNAIAMKSDIANIWGSMGIPVSNKVGVGVMFLVTHAQFFVFNLLSIIEL